MADDAAPTSARPVPVRPRKGRAWLFGAVALVLVAAGGFAVFQLAKDRSSGSVRGIMGLAETAGTASPGDDRVTPCGSEPEFTPRSAQGDPDGVTVTFEVHATCSGGQWLDSAAYRLRISGDPDGASDGSRLADGLFDFSASPIWIPDSDGGAGSRVHAHFPVGQLWATDEEISNAIGRGAVLVDCEPEDGTAGGPQQAPADRGRADSGSAASETSDAVLDAASREENSLAALERLRRQDRSLVGDELVDAWVPQLSSKQYGTHDPVDDLTYDHTAIYEEHLRLRLELPSVRLLWSGDWASFLLKDFWVTVANEPSGTAAEANDWCDASGRDVTQCFAKLIRLTGSHEDTTELRD